MIGRITKENRRMFEGSGEIILPNGDVAVTATAKYMKLPIDKIVEGDFIDDEWIEVNDKDKVDYIEY